MMRKFLKISHDPENLNIIGHSLTKFGHNFFPYFEDFDKKD